MVWQIAKNQREAMGVQRREGRRRIVIEFDQDTFDAIKKLAVNERTSFAEQVRLLVEWGLEA